MKTKKTNASVPLWAAAVLVLLGVVGALTFFNNRQSTEQAPSSESAQVSDAAKKFRQEYAGVDADNRFVYASSQEVVELFESGTGLVFLGFEECPWCQQLAPIVDDAAEVEGLEKIYYVDIRQARNDNDEFYQRLVGYLDEYLQKDDEGQPRIYVPDVTALRDGEIVGKFKQESTKERLGPEAFWTDERRERGVEQLRKMIRNITESE